MIGATPDDWFVPTSPRPHANLTVFAYPQAGGGCTAFSPQARTMPDWLEMATLSLPGRQARFDEPLCTDLEELTSRLVEYCAKHAGPFMFFGYCAGALLAYSVASGLQAEGLPMPERLVVGSFLPPHRAAATISFADLDSETFWKILVDNNAISPDLAAHADLRDLSEPAIRADMALTAGYKNVSRPPLKIPITLLTGERDEWLASGDAQGWADYTSAVFDVRMLPAGHWFMEEDPVASVAALVEVAEEIRR